MKSTPLEPVLRENLLMLARAYAGHRGILLRTVSRDAHGESSFFDMLEEQHKYGERRAGDRKGSFTIRQYDKLIAWFHGRWPKDVEWPKLATITRRRPK